jgi:2-oxoisovalerate dehydrogenase E1 component
MKGYDDGAILAVIGEDQPGSVKELAVDFLLYGALAEIFGREAGFNKGMGGSMHAFFTPFGVYPNNAIVGGSADISVGAALFKRVNRKPGIVIANIGDAAAGCGPTWEALCFATMDQFTQLWDASVRGGLPLIMNFVNNFYGMGGQPSARPWLRDARRMGAGLTPTQMHAERVGRLQPARGDRRHRAQKGDPGAGEGPVLLDTITYRFSGHSPSDASSYREKTEIEEWQQVDSLRTYGDDLVKAGLVRRGGSRPNVRGIDEAILRAYRMAIDLDASPRANLYVPATMLERTIVLERTRRVVRPGPRADGSCRRAEPARPAARRPSRSGARRRREPAPQDSCVGVRDALFEASLDRFYKDPTWSLRRGEPGLGRGRSPLPRPHRGAPLPRLFQQPDLRGAIVGTAGRLRLEGGRALVELMYCDFLGRAGDEVFNQLSKWQSMSGGMLRMPVVLRVSVGSKYGAQHSQDWTALVAHIPGLKVVFPATPYDAKGLMNAALTGTDRSSFSNRSGSTTSPSCSTAPKASRPATTKSRSASRRSRRKVPT